MNYIELINNFWAYTEEKEISSSDTSVYFALLKFNNSLNWIKTFRCDYPIICQYARVSKNTFYRSLDSLQDLGLISYQKGERNTLKPKISVLNLKNKKGTIKEQEGNSKGIVKEQNEEQKGNLYKLLNKETIKLLNNKTNSDLVNQNLKKWLGLEKENKNETKIYPTFQDFWNEYDKKVGDKEKLQKKWDKLNQETKEKIMQYIPLYKKSQPDKKYRKNAETFFNNQSWNDEIISEPKNELPTVKFHTNR